MQGGNSNNGRGRNEEEPWWGWWYGWAFPLVLTVLPAVASQYLVISGSSNRHFQTSILLGSPFSWSLSLSFLVWAWASLRVLRGTIITGPSPEGPGTQGEKPAKYRDNGVLYYWSSLALGATLLWLYPGAAIKVYHQMPEIVATQHWLALALCTTFFLNSKPEASKRSGGGKPWPLRFFRGTWLHPQFLGVDAKQLTNCRVGMMSWQLLSLTFFVASGKIHGQIDHGALASLLIQSAYIAKFFWWERGYFWTLDMTLDRAGFYLMWGCLVWIPSLYAHTSYFFVAHPTHIPLLMSGVLLGLGVVAVVATYVVDRQKQRFKEASAEGRILAEFKYVEASQKRLLTGGCWGLARHMNYTLELTAAFLWSAPGIGLGQHPFLYWLFLLCLLMHRLMRDEEKCKKKYGDLWVKYCKAVPFRLIPLFY